MSKIFITGANGFIGRQLVKKLAESGETVHALIRNEKNAGGLVHPNIKLFYGDITHPESLALALKGCERVYHIAAFAKLSAKDPKIFYEVNVRGTANVLKQAYEAGVKKVVYTSSAAVYGPSLKQPLCEKDPRTIGFNADYDLSKYLAECLVKDYVHKGLFTVIVNPTRVYGPGHLSHSNAISKMLLQCLQGKTVLIPGCKKVRGNYAFIDDVVNGHIHAMEKGLGGEKYILGGLNISYEEMLSTIREQIKVRSLALSPMLMKTWSWVELMKSKLSGKDPLITPETVNRYLVNAEFSCQKAINQLGYSITPFNDGIKKTIDYLTESTHD